MLEFIAAVPFTLGMAYAVLALIALLLIASALKTRRETVAARAAYADMLRSRANHPAGKARELSPRHLDVAGYDWVNGTL